jgi:phospholipase C
MLSLRSSGKSPGSSVSVKQLAQQHNLSSPISVKKLLLALGFRDSIEHVFVLMLENRSFDHMLGFSQIEGTDATTGRRTTIEGLKGTESNTFGGNPVTADGGARDVMGEGPGHEFMDVLEQLCGPDAAKAYQFGDPYPPINNSGFMSNYAKNAVSHPASDVMKCFRPDQLPVLNALAREFLVCDHWFSSMPGPTEPNRYFMHAATSGDFDESPTPGELAEAVGRPGSGFEFAHGTVFNHLERAGVKYRIYADDRTPVAAELDGISVVRDIDEFEDFAEDLRDPSFDANYVHIEPNYDAVFGHFAGGNSQHPRGSVAAGERFIKATYEAIRNSPLWAKSLLIITWDEHGGFYDHVPPGRAAPTGERGSKHGFMFDHLGPRVPALVVSPLIPKNLIAKEIFDHTTIYATLRRVFNLPKLGERDGMSGGVNHHAGLSARTDTPMKLPDAATPAVAEAQLLPTSRTSAPSPDALLADNPDSLQGAQLHSAVVQHLQVAPAAQRDAIIDRFQLIRTQADAFAYLQEVGQLVRAKRAEVRNARVSPGPGQVPANS